MHGTGLVALGDCSRAYPQLQQQMIQRDMCFWQRTMHMPGQKTILTRAGARSKQGEHDRPLQVWPWCIVI